MLILFIVNRFSFSRFIVIIIIIIISSSSSIVMWFSTCQRLLEITNEEIGSLEIFFYFSNTGETHRIRSSNMSKNEDDKHMAFVHIFLSV